LLRLVDLAALVLVVLGGIALGWFTPTETASVGASISLVLCALRRKLSFAVLRDALADTLKTTGMIYVVIAGAMIFSVFMSLTGLAEQVAGLMAALPGDRLLAVVVMAVMLLILGSVLDGLALMLLATPILLPIIAQLGLSPIWFGIFLVRTMEIGFVHPPIGINLYVIQGIAKDVPLMRIFKGVLPFLAADFLHLGLLIGVPALALALPEWFR
jgi:tripartite ATP-independent transporter DctM subunit